ncbi:MAG TPA: hypothetical protein VGW98_02775 [Solirubrobacteraceae bacterium]|nr:hypothetical protein [Solirubrobacteraceae bacterium]
MFILTALVYPVVLAVLCVGAGLLVDWASGRFLPGALLPAVGAAALIGISQLTTYAWPLAPATPYVMVAVAVAGFLFAWGRVLMLARRWRAWAWQIVAPVLVYIVALAPVLFAGRPTFSSYTVLTDSAVHMIGADFLIRHGQHYAHLDLRNSYGQFINAYYNTSYPSGSDTLFGGSAFLLRLPLIWAFQPFNAFMLATAAGPARLLARRLGLDGGWATLAALTATLPALVYGYELVGSIKEITALPMILTLGVLVVLHARWLRGPPAGATPFALVAAAGVSALGVGFGAWVLAAVATLAVVAIGDGLAGRQSARRALLLTGLGAIIALVFAWPTWIDLTGSLRVAQNIASTSNPGNLTAPLRAVQVFGTWLWAGYTNLPKGGDLRVTQALIVITFIACVLGALHVTRIREYPLAGWLALTLVVWLAVTEYATNWVDAKTLMLTSPVVVLLAWGGVAALRALPLRTVFRPAATLLALALTGGVLASDAMQYHSSSLAPTARYDELASLNARFAGRGPTLFTDFDEYALYELRDLDISGVDFLYPPVALAGLSTGHGGAIDLDRAPPAKLRAYPLIITRRDPSASRPPAAYRLIWQGTYYQAWRRRPGAPAAIAHVGLPSTSPVQCPRVQRLAQLASTHGAQLVAARPSHLVRISVTRAHHPASWTRGRVGLVMNGPGRLWATFAVPRAGEWDLWLQGEIMRPVHASFDGVPLGAIGGQLGGNSLNPETMTPLRAHLAAGRHLLSLTRGGFSLAPGDGGWAILDYIFLTPAGAASQQTLRVATPADWRSLCGRVYDWIEVVPR